MDIIASTNRQEFLACLPQIKPNLPEWQFVEIRLVQGSGDEPTGVEAAGMVQELFQHKEGKIYICNNFEILMLIRWGANTSVQEVPRQIEQRMPPGTCEVFVHEASIEGIMKVEMIIRQTGKKKSDIPEFAQIRADRKENVVLVADDDMYMRMLVKKGLSGLADQAHEVVNGSEVMDAYKRYIPNILFLDIHMPGRNGQEVLADILAVDPAAYVIMLSSDSSVENVEFTVKKGAKGFLAKPFSKDRLLEYYYKACPARR